MSYNFRCTCAWRDCKILMCTVQTLILLTSFLLVLNVLLQYLYICLKHIIYDCMHSLFCYKTIYKYVENNEQWQRFELSLSHLFFSNNNVLWMLWFMSPQQRVLVGRYEQSDKSNYKVRILNKDTDNTNTTFHCFFIVVLRSYKTPVY